MAFSRLTSHVSPVDGREHLFICGCFQIERDGVDAIAQARRSRAVVENVPQVGVATGAGDFNAAHAKTQVFVLVDASGVNGVKKAGPAAVRVEFLIRAKEFRLATHAAVHAFVSAVPIHAGEGAFRALLTADIVLFGRELSAPFRVCFGDFFV